METIEAAVASAQALIEPLIAPLVGWKDPFSLLLDRELEQLSTVLSFPLDQLKYVAMLLMAYPIALIFRMLPNNAVLKHCVGMFVGMFMAWYIVGWQILHSFFTATVAYVLALVLPRRMARTAIFVFSMGYMMLSHIYRLYTDYMGWSMDFTGPQMLLTIKLTSFAFDFHDGSRPEKELNEHQKERCVKKLPSLLEWYAWTYFFLGFLAGPCFELREYLSFIDLSMFKEVGDKAPYSLRVVLVKLVTVVLCGVALTVAGMYPASFIRSDAFLVDTPFHMRFLIGWLVGSLARFSYYFGWTLAEGSCCVAGIGFSGLDKKTGAHMWTRATNVRIMDIELAQNFKGITDAWNIRTDHWLKHYVYDRVQSTAFKSHAVAITFLTSAVWHGFYPGYYLSFMTAAFQVQLMRSVRRTWRPLFLGSPSLKGLYDVITVVLTGFSLNYTMIPFLLLSWEGSIGYWRSLYFCGHILLIGGLVVTRLLGATVLRPPKPATKTQ